MAKHACVPGKREPDVVMTGDPVSAPFGAKKVCKMPGISSPTVEQEELRTDMEHAV